MATLLKEVKGGWEFKEGGARVDAIKYDGKSTKVVGHYPMVGCSLLVGSVTARSYSSRDYWLTTEISEILEDTEDYVKFRTKNSIYKLMK